MSAVAEGGEVTVECDDCGTMVRFEGVDFRGAYRAVAVAGWVEPSSGMALCAECVSIAEGFGLSPAERVELILSAAVQRSTAVVSQ